MYTSRGEKCLCIVGFIHIKIPEIPYARNLHKLVQFQEKEDDLCKEVIKLYKSCSYFASLCFNMQ